jgi:DNA replication protein DnaC
VRWRRKHAATATPHCIRAPSRCFAISPSLAPTAVYAPFWPRLSRLDVLVIDDWAMAPLAETERRDFWEICEDRYQTRSTILTSQLPVARWHEQIGDPTAADGILDRLVHNAHRIEMRGDSMRKNRGKPNA